MRVTPSMKAYGPTLKNARRNAFFLPVFLALSNTYSASASVSSSLISVTTPALTSACTVTRPRASFLSEDYLILAVHELETPLDADALLAARGVQLAQMLRGETAALSAQEQDEVLRNRLSYLSNDLVIPTWNAAFVYDTEAGAAAALELFEFTNSQLLEFRYYDTLLDAELARLYPALQNTSWWRNLFGGVGILFVHLGRVERIGAEEGVHDGVLFAAGLVDVRFQQALVEQVDDPQTTER